MSKRNAVPVTTILIAVAWTAIAILSLTHMDKAEAKPDHVEPVPTKPENAPARITVVDQTAGNWHGLAAVVRGWNRSPLVDIRISDTCQPDTYCVVVDAWEHGHANWAGLTSFIQPGMAHVQANASLTYYTPEMQSAVLCHELGHALGGIPDGLTDGRGCIAGGDEIVPVPSRDDLALLREPRQFGAIAFQNS